MDARTFGDRIILACSHGRIGSRKPQSWKIVLSSISLPKIAAYELCLKLYILIVLPRYKKPPHAAVAA